MIRQELNEENVQTCQRILLEGCQTKVMFSLLVPSGTFPGLGINAILSEKQANMSSGSNLTTFKT
jgi:hypothetical protein